MKSHKLLIRWIIAILAITALVMVAALFRGIKLTRLRGPLISAIQDHDTSLALNLLRLGADPNSRNTGQCSCTQSDFVGLLLHPQAAAIQDAKAATALQLAIYNNEPTVIHALVDNGADVNAFSSFWPFAHQRHGDAALNFSDTEPIGYTALMAACALEDVDTVHLLLTHGANPNFHRPDENSCIVLALLDYTRDVWQIYYRNTVSNRARADDDIDIVSGAKIVRDLLDHGANAGETVMHDQTALKIALNTNWPAVLPLLQHGADLNTHTQFPDGENLLLAASDRSDMAVISYLLEHGADPNSANNDGRTALIQVAHRYFSTEVQLDALKILLEHKADPNKQDRFGISALMEAAGVGNKEPFSFADEPSLAAIQTLVQYGAKVGVRAVDGRTAVERLAPKIKRGDFNGAAALKLLKSAN